MKPDRKTDDVGLAETPETGRQVMRKFLAIAVVFWLSALVSVAAAQTVYCDAYGNCSGRVGGQNYQSYTDSYGNTTGRIGNDSFQSYTDNFGNTTGRIGNDRFSCYTDNFGNTTCR